MKIAELIKGITTKKDADVSNELDQALDQILKIEKKREAAEAELTRTRKALDEAQAAAIDGDDGNVPDAVRVVVGAQAALDSLDNLLRQAKAGAVGLIAAGSVAHRKRSLSRKMSLFSHSNFCSGSPLQPVRQGSR